MRREGGEGREGRGCEEGGGPTDHQQCIPSHFLMTRGQRHMIASPKPSVHTEARAGQAGPC